MVITLLVSLLSFADVPKPVAEPLVTEAFVRDGKLVIAGKEFQATAQRFTISPDGKSIDLRGMAGEPATLMSRTGGPQTRMEITGQRIIFSPSEGTVHVIGAGKVVEPKPK